MKYYLGSDGEYYSDRDIWERLEAGEWRVFAWDDDAGQEWVEVDRTTIVCLTPVDETVVPEGTLVEPADR